jgi:hypothetical protein
MKKVRSKVVRNAIAESPPAIAATISILQTKSIGQTGGYAEEKDLLKMIFLDSTNKSASQSRKAEPHQCGDIADTLWRAPRSLTRLWLGFRLSRSPFRTCLTYPVGVGRSAKTPTCESLCAGFRFKSHRRTCLWRCGWVAFLLGVLTRSTRRKRNPADT